MKLVMRAAYAAGILATGLALSTGAVNAQTKIGALYPFSGGLALLGDESFRGLELATEERNAAGGVKGQPLQIVKGDVRLWQAQVVRAEKNAEANKKSGKTNTKAAPQAPNAFDRLFFFYS